MFFFNDTATTEIYTLSLHDALPICATGEQGDWSAQRQGSDPTDRTDADRAPGNRRAEAPQPVAEGGDRKSTRLNSSHANISYAVFCLKKKTIYVAGLDYSGSARLLN